MAEQPESETDPVLDPITEPEGIPSTAHVSNGNPADVVDFDALNAALAPTPLAPVSSKPIVADSEGRSSATYASQRPHTIPKSTFVHEEHVPAVIVSDEEPTVENEIPVHTVRMRPSGGVRTVPYASSAPFAAPSYLAPAAEATGPMYSSRRGRAQTVVLRERRPSSVQKIAVFVGLLVIVVAAGIAVLLYLKPTHRLF